MTNDASDEIGFAELREKTQSKRMSEKNELYTEEFMQKSNKLNVSKVELELQNEELLAMQKKLVRSNKAYIELFDEAPVGYFILNGEGVILKVNKTGSKKLGIEKSKLVRKSLSDFLHTEVCRANYAKHRAMVINSEKEQQFECEIKKYNGSVFSGLIKTRMIKNEKNQFKYFLSMISDISKRKVRERKMEAALVMETELNEMKSQFITIASHEFRTPLAAILLSADLAEKYTELNDLDNKSKHFKRIKSSVDRLKNILGDFLSIGQIEKGLLVSKPESFKINEFAMEFIQEIKTLNKNHIIKLFVNGDKQEVFLDRKLLRMCLSNLIGNAIKYSPSGGTIELATMVSSGGDLKIQIQDYGAGIPQNDQPFIFDQFYRAKNVQTVQGIGLGLNMTQKIISIMGGSISFESTENKGSTFILAFSQN